MDRKAIRHLATVGRSDRRKGERLARRRLKTGTSYYTGTGIRNQVARVDDDNIYIRSSRNNVEVKFPLKAIVASSAYLYRIRQVERKELEVFHKFTSSLFGLLRYIFDNAAKVYQQSRFLRLVMMGIRFFLAGADKCPRDLNVAHAAGARFILLSYFYLRDKQTWKAHVKRLGLRVLLDSGAFSVYRAQVKGKKVKDINLNEYCQFIRDNMDILEGYFNLDVIGSPEKTRENLCLMEQQGLDPIPVFHMGSPLAELDRLVKDGYPVIGLGGTVGIPEQKRVEFLGMVFNRHPNQCFHGLGISSLSLLSTFPFFSCDSRTWIAGRSYGRLVFPGSIPKHPLMAMAENVRNYVKLENADFYMRLTKIFKQSVQLTLQFD